MLRLVHPEVLARDWLPPVLLDRAREVAEVRRRVEAALESARDRAVMVIGAPGSGTSSVARAASRAILQELRHDPAHPPPLLACVRSDAGRGSQSIATSLLQLLDPGFSGRGFHTTEILAGFLRRLRRQERPCVVVLDDIGPGTNDLKPILRAFSAPDCFLPEGESGMPPLALVLAGSPDARGAWAEAARRGWAADHRVRLTPYAPISIERILRDRAQRALGREPPEEWFSRFLRRVRARAPGATLALQLLARELAEPAAPSARSISVGVEFPTSLLEPPLLAALARASSRRQATVAELRRWEAEYAEREGSRPLPATTFWRRIVRLESVGLVHREVRAGGAGGTRSVVELLRPITGPTALEPRDTPPVVGWSASPLSVSMAR